VEKVIKEMREKKATVDYDIPEDVLKLLREDGFRLMAPLISNIHEKRLRWSRGSVLPLSTQVHGFKPVRSHQDFSGQKNPHHAFLRKGSKAVGPMLQICGI
jgi:hypothetical protein